MSRGTAIAYAIGLPLALLGLIFLPAGTIAWWPGWIFLAVMILGFGVSALVLARVNPVIYRARSRFQAGTKSWDKKLLAIILPAMAAVLPVAALDAGRLVKKRVQSERPVEPLSIAWRAGAQGNALQWWVERLGDPAFMKAVLDSSRRAYAVKPAGPRPAAGAAASR